MSDFFDLGDHPLAQGSDAALLKQYLAKFQRLAEDIQEIHERIKFLKHDITVLEKDSEAGQQALRALQKTTVRRTAKSNEAAREAYAALQALGFSTITPRSAAPEDTTMSAAESVKVVARELQTKAINLRMKRQELERMYKALGSKLKERVRIQERLEKRGR